MFNLMHLSDLHRSEQDPISNDELVSCLVADLERYRKERPPILAPDAVLISGDLVQGLPLNSAQYPKGLEQQYDEALDLLERLADRFVQGDRSKIIIVPGNHDVDWNMARKAMKPVERQSQLIPTLLTLTDTRYRWSWSDLQLYEVADSEIYEQRLAAYNRMYSRFYQDVDLGFALNPKRAWNGFLLDEGRILVCGFNSCVNNDCFNFAGNIPFQAVAQSHLELVCTSPARLKIAVWHHDVAGPPTRADYMDADTVALMIDKGYRLGLHGHQHKSDALPYSLHTSQTQTMALISAGSLCAGARDLPTGLRRQYNMIQIADDYLSARVHVREMHIRGVFVPGRLIVLGGKSFADIRWSPAESPRLVDAGRSGGWLIEKVEKIEQLVLSHDYLKALEEIKSNASHLGDYARQLTAEVLFRSEEWEKLLEHISEPRNIDELGKFTRAIIATKQWTRGEEVLMSSKRSPSFPLGSVRELIDAFNAERKLSE